MSSDSRLMFLPVWSSCCRKHLTTLNKFWLLFSFASQSLVCRALSNRGKGNFKRKWVNRKERKKTSRFGQLENRLQRASQLLYLLVWASYTHACTHKAQSHLTYRAVWSPQPSFFFCYSAAAKNSMHARTQTPPFSLEWLDAHSEPRQVSGSLCPALACFYKKFNSILVY